MTFDQLRIFVAVAERLHVTRAAEELGLTQSGASAAIAALESRYGLELFHRIGRRIELTEAGRLFQVSAKAVLSQVAIAERELCELSSMERGTLSIYASQTVANYWLPARVGEFRRNFPNISVKIQVGNSGRAAAALANGSADIAFVEGLIDDPTLKRRDIPGDRLVLIRAAGQSPHRRDKVELSDLKNLRWVLREKGSGTREIFEQALSVAGIDPSTLDVVLELPSNEAVLTAVEAGIGSSVVSDQVANRTRLRAVDVGLRPRAYSVLQHRERTASEAQKAMLGIATRQATNIVDKPRRSAVA
jgi:DNA-binding transcriptional LysR family regulator